MASGSLDFLINVQQKLTGGNVVSQLSQLEAKIKGEAAALAQLEAVQKRMQKSDSVDIEQHRKLQTQIDLKKSSLAGLGEEYSKLTEQQGATTGGMEALGGQMSELAAGPIGMVAAAVVALVAILVVGAAALMSFALGAADAHRSMMLMLQGATGSAAAANADAAAIDRVASSSALAKEQIAGMGQSLAVAGLSGKLFEDTLKTIALVSSVAGAEAGQKLEDVAKKAKALGHFEIKAKGLQGLGISMEDVAKQLGLSVAQMDAQMKAGKITTEQGMGAMNKALSARFGDVGAKQMLGFDTQMLKLKENVTGLFKDVQIEGFLKAMQSVLSVFDQNTSTGKALHLIITKVFSGAFDAISAAAPYIKAFLIGMVMGLLLVYINAKKVWNALRDAFGGGESMSQADKLKIAMYAGVAVVGIFVGVLVALAVVLAILAVGFIIAAVAIALPFIIIGLFIYQIYKLVDAITSIDFPNLGDAAGNMVDGLVQGIESKIGDVVAAMSALGTKAKDSLLSVLGIHSPSRVMMSAGGFTAQGFAEGVDDGASKAQGAMARMAEPPDMAAGGKPGKGGGKGKIHVDQIGPFYGVGADTIDMIEEGITALFERLDLSGPEPEPEPT